MNNNNSKTVGSSMEETRDKHIRYLRAINNPLRRNILKLLKNKHMTIKNLIKETNLDEKTLIWHLNILEWGYCIEKSIINNNCYYEITQEGKVIDYI